MKAPAMPEEKSIDQHGPHVRKKQTKQRVQSRDRKRTPKHKAKKRKQPRNDSVGPSGPRTRNRRTGKRVNVTVHPSVVGRRMRPEHSRVNVQQTANVRTNNRRAQRRRCACDHSFLKRTTTAKRDLCISCNTIRSQTGGPIKRIRGGKWRDTTGNPHQEKTRGDRDPKETNTITA